ncbi:hypothetical protein GCM10010123_17260 [Pilimelia anulata]|uniref:DUF3566 domain-containing protein n=1 Tax=Pilimelia anulata TaxID=53371 RepID=A0A8J3B6H3_9ACTN|nr:DUF3566 domain-containing protein [Pilimelia anulata]GGJ88193.1 hypothetical protein GCM10010123_17260 [Pilimelia anulata]
MTETQAKSGATGAPADGSKPDDPDATRVVTRTSAAADATGAKSAPAAGTSAPGSSQGGTPAKPAGQPPTASASASADKTTRIVPGNAKPAAPAAPPSKPAAAAKPAPAGPAGTTPGTAGKPAPAAPAKPQPGPGGKPGQGPNGTGKPAPAGAGNNPTAPIRIAAAARSAATTMPIPTGAAVKPAPTAPGATGAARVAEAVRAARGAATGTSRGPRRARLHLKRVDPWSVMKLSFALSIVLFIVIIVATSVLYLVLDAMGVFDKVNSTLVDLVNAGGGSGSGSFMITAKGVIGSAALLGLVNIVLMTALATLSAFIYNVCADLVGGVELTLAERD